MKMRMLKLKMRANHLKSQVKEGLNRTSSFAGYDGPAPDNLVCLGAEIVQGDCEEGPTQIDVSFTAMAEADGRAAMDAMGVPSSEPACVCINIELLPGLDGSVQEELQGIYDMLFDMAGGEDALASASEEMGYPVHKPVMKVADVDGVSCLQIIVYGGINPLEMFGADARLLKTLHGRVQLAHTLEEVIMAEGDTLDVFSLEGGKVNLKAERDRKLVEWVANSEEAKGAIPEEAMEEMAPALAAALTFGSASMNVKVRSIQDAFNKEIRDAFPAYNQFLEEFEEYRCVNGDMTTGMLTGKIVEIYGTLDGPIQNMYKEIKSKIAGPHSAVIILPTAKVALTTKGLNCAHKFFPTPEEIEAHPAYSGGGASDDDDDW